MTEGHCELCDRTRPRTFHHLIPRALHSTHWFRSRYSREELASGVWLCRDCHNAVHRFIEEKTLGREFNTLTALVAHPQVAEFVQWVAGQKGQLQSHAKPAARSRQKGR